MNAIKYVVHEHYTNLKKINTLAVNEIKIYAKGSGLGYWWTLVKDIIYFIAYGAFMTLLYGNTEIGGVPRLVYLVSALIPWYFISDCLGGGANAIKKRGGILTKIKFPISIVPTYEILSIFYKRIASYLIIIVVLGMYGYLNHFNLFQFVYYQFAMICFLMAFNQLISGFVAISKDFAEFYSAMVRILFFFVPILWSFETIGGVDNIAVKLVALNPLVYLIEGMRSAFVYNNPISLDYSIYFWVVTLLVFLVGAFVQNKLKRLYADFF
ncbi:MAG: ABC transporter permease [Mycoplasmatales bacterium]